MFRIITSQFILIKILFLFVVRRVSRVLKPFTIELQSIPNLLMQRNGTKTTPRKTLR